MKQSLHEIKASRISIARARDHYTITLTGDEPLTYSEVRDGLDQLEHDVPGPEQPTFRLVGFTPGQFVGWDLLAAEEAFCAFDQFVEIPGTTPPWHLVEVGRLPATRERLLELLSSEYPGIRELAQQWMAPLVNSQP